MAEEAALGEDGEEVEDPQELAERLKPELLDACLRNDTEAALRLIDQHADPCCEDNRQWSPLIWAANHGNDALTRVLISRGAAEVYKYDDAAGLKVVKKKHSPLHWAAFKGHLKVLWLLMAPPHNLSHHEKDAIGNTPLHQAAAGGSLDCAKCLMAQGVDVFAKNNRGHTPFALCTVPEVQELLKKAMECKACKATGKQFSATVMRYLCSWSLDAFCENAVTQLYVYESPEATEKECPVTWCTEVKNMVQEAEHQLIHAMNLNQLDTVTEALVKADDKPVDCKLVHQCSHVKAKLESEIQLVAAMQVQVVTNLDEFQGVHEMLSQAIEDAEDKSADAGRVEAARTLRKKLLSEASLMRAVGGPQKTTPGHILMLEELHRAATDESANEALLDEAGKLIAKLKSEREVQKRIAETAPLCEFETYKDAAGKENLPPWSVDTEEFETFHEDFKRVVEEAERDKIDEDLMAKALEQLAGIENLLVEKKRFEEEDKLKNAKKKGKKK
uniref:Uncharacterized protein n=1 Tax=Zooxanthella nutricula TaxID=1333877 RepID=A0A7S2MVT5_9DINO